MRWPMQYSVIQKARVNDMAKSIVVHVAEYDPAHPLNNAPLITEVAVPVARIDYVQAYDGKQMGKYWQAVNSQLKFTGKDATVWYLTETVAEANKLMNEGA